MYLKSIEVQGFKSFANKIRFEFHNGITGIVGPNGSGKSNVADAVRWVLGEQSAKSLRGGSMQDVIFAGTENRKPLSFAYVAITLDNSDHKLETEYTEVTVARRLYRSGESEYLMNGSPCRLRDINELFYDTGIGKEGYSIIGQGQIDKILSTRPEETRELFDEATGIVKFKRRKNEAQKKLFEEQQDIVRINDIVSELEKQLAPLEKQSAKAKEYLRRKEELKSYDVNLFLLESKRIDGELSSVQEKAEVTGAELAATQEGCDKLKGACDKADGELGALDGRIQETADGLNSVSLKIQEAGGRIELLKEQIRSAVSGEDRVRERISAIEKSLEEKNASREAAAKEKEKLDNDLMAAASLSSDADERLRNVRGKSESLDREAAKIQSELIKLLNTRASSKGRLQRIDATREQIELRKADLDAQLEDSREAERSKQQECDRLKADFENVCEEIRALTQRHEAEEKAYEEYRVKLGTLNEEIEAGQSAYHLEASRLEALKNVSERYEGFGGAVRKVMEQRGRFPGIHGVVADLFKVDRKYETAIETALGGNIRNVVTEDEDTAKQLIAYLKKNRLGRATFLPLDSVRTKDTPLRKEILSERGVVGTACSLVSTDSRYMKIADYLLGRMVVAEDIDAAVRVAGKYCHSLHIVTLEGEYLRPGGSMTGGSYKNAENLLGRKRELKELEETVNKLKEELDGSRARMEKVKEERRGSRARAGTLEESLSACFIRQNTAKLSVDQAEKELEEIRSGYEGLKSGIQAFEEQIDDLRKTRDALDAELGTYEGNEQEKEDEARSVREAIGKMKAEEELISKEAGELHMKEAGILQRSGFLQENIDRLDEEIRALDSEKSGLLEKSRLSGFEVSDKEKEIASLKRETEKLKGRETELQKTSGALRLEREELNAGRKACMEEREELLEKKALLDKEMYRLDALRGKLEENAASLADYMWQEYELTYNLALPYKNEEYTDPVRLKKMTSALKDEIKKLGDVNVNAIEDYKNISERHAFMSTQRDDLAKAEEALKSVISDLDAGMRLQFENGFARIREEFDSAFKELFGGGKGTLEIDTESDILEAGVRIIAQPPGKKLQNMMQLSGGEKALTAIALLFAIQNMKPSPFCLLDEIEAALDDSNIGRFSRYLHKLTKNTQFIIITHRKGTMEAADRLYGITMQEKGVSALVSVNLIEEELDV